MGLPGDGQIQRWSDSAGEDADTMMVTIKKLRHS
jgi:hypothetical protein